MFNVQILSVDLVERSRVVEAALPHLVDDLLRMCLVFDLRSCLHGQLGASAHTSLELFRDAPLIPCEELACETTLSAQSACADLQMLVSTICCPVAMPYLQTSLMSQIVRLDFPLQMVPRMHHLMRHGIFLMPSVPELVRAQ